MTSAKAEDTATPPLTLNELERDALAELANIGVSRAASSLRKMVGQQVLLSVPSVEVMSQKTAAALIAEREGNRLIAVQQEFSGSFSGRAMLIFPEAKSLELVRAIVGPDIDKMDAAEVEEEALAETGNIILNGCLATMANILHQSLSVSLPQVTRGTGARLFQIGEEQTDSGLVLFLYINFSILDLDMRGYIAMLMDLPSLAALKVLLGQFIASVMGEEANQPEASGI
jgi:chemotaxis protein CheC